MNAVSKPDRVAGGVGLNAMLESLLESMYLADPDLAQAVLYCSIPRWFDRAVAAGMCAEGVVSSSARDEVFQKLLSLTFCSPHPTRAETWQFQKAFRAHFLTRPELTDRWQELHSRAAQTFKRMLEAKGLKGDQRFQDEDWRLVAVEWLYHLLQLDQDAGLAALTIMCAEALSIPVYQGPSWEIDFCVRLLADLEWPPDAESLTVAIGDLKKGFGYLAVGQNAKALAMVKRLADVPGLRPEQAGELHHFAGITHLYDEGKTGPALEELGKAAMLTPNRAAVHAEIAAVHYLPGTTWGRLDLAEESAREAIRVEPRQAEGHVALGQIYAEQEDWEQAIHHFREAIKVEPDDTKGYVALSEAYAARRQVAQAIELIDKAWEISPGGEYYAAIRRGQVFASARRFDRAREEFERAIALAPDLPDMYIHCGWFHQQTDELAEAAEMYNKAIELDPTVEDGYLALARLYDGQGKLQKALDTCQRSLANGAEGKGIYIELSALYEQQERLADLEKVQDKLVALDSLERYGSYCAVGDAWLAKAQKRRDSADQPTWLMQAQAEFEKALDLDQKRAWAYMSLGRLHVWRGEYDQLDELERAVAARTPWAQYDLLVSMGQACLANYDGKTCEMLLNRAVDLAPRRVSGWRALGDLYAWQGDPAGVAQAWEQAVKIDPALRYDAHIALGDIYQHIGDYARAHQEVSEVVDLEPNTGRGYLRLGAVAEAAGNPGEAVEQYQTAAETASGLAPLALTNIARLQRQQHELLAAERTLRRAIDLDPDQSDAYLELARLGAMCDRQSLVAEAYEQIGSMLPDQFYDLQLALGDAYRSVGQFDDARKAFDHCRERDPDRADAYVRLAQVLKDQEQLDDARALVARAIEVDSTSLDAYAILSQLCEAQDDVEGVISAQRRIVELAPTERYNACMNVGGVYEKVGQVAAAEQQYREALASYPWQPDAYVALGLLLAHLGRPAEAGDLYEKAKPEAGLNYLDLGAYLEREGKLDDAIETYTIGKKYEPKEAQVDLCLAAGLLQERQERPDEAQLEYEQAVALDPQRPEGYVALMYLLADQGRLDEAIKVCHQMAEQPQLAYNAYVSLGNLLEEKKDYNKAEKAYRQAVEFAPEVSDAYVQLGQLLLHQERPNDAVQAYRQMAKQPQLACDAFLLLGDLWVGLGKYKEAEKAYRQAIKADRQEPASYLRLAQLLVQQERWEDAAQAYRQMAKQPQLACHAHLLLGDLWVGLEKHREAEKAYRQAIKAERQEPASYLRLAQLYMQQTEFGKAEKLIQDARQAAPDSPDPYIVLAQLREQQGRVDDALELYRQVAQLKPVEASAAYERTGDLLIDKERYDEAVTALQQAVQKDPANAGAYFSLGTIYEQQAEPKEAIAMYAKVIEVDPEYLNAYVALGRVYGQQGNKPAFESVVQQLMSVELTSQDRYAVRLATAELYEAVDEAKSAVASYEWAMALDPQRPEGYVGLMYLLADQGRLDEAVNVCHQMAEQPQLAYNAYVSLGNLLVEKQNYKEAEKAYRQAIKADRQQPVSYLLLAQLCMGQAELSKAEKLIQDARQAAPDSPDPYIVLAQLREQQGRVDDALELYHQVAQLKPVEASAAYERIGDLLIGQERYDEAVTALQQAMQWDPANAGAYFSLGTIYEQQADLEQAIAMYARAIEVNPKYFDAYVTLGRLYGRQKEITKLAQLAKQLLSQKLQPAETYDAHVAIGAAYLEAQALEWALDEFSKSRDLDPERTEAYLALGQVYEMQERWADAREVYSKLGELVPAWQPDVHYKLGDLYWLEGEWSEAEQEYRQAITLAPERWEGYYSLAQLYMTQEQWSKAAEIWEHITRLKDIDPVTACSAYLYLADVRRTLGDPEGMLAACSRVVSVVKAIGSPNSDLLRQKGLALYMQGKYDEASNPLLSCLEADPEDVKAHFYLALNLLCQGKRAEANQRFKLGRACIKEGAEFNSAIREAKVLAARTPEIVGAKEMLERLEKAAGDATP